MSANYPTLFHGVSEDARPAQSYADEPRQSGQSDLAQSMLRLESTTFAREQPEQTNGNAPMSDRPNTTRSTDDGNPYAAHSGGGSPQQGELVGEVATLIDQISHDLRSALNGIQSWAYVLDQSLDAPPPPAQRALTGLHTAMQQQIALIQHLEESVRLLADTSPPDWQQADLADIANEAIGTLRPGAEARQVKLADVAITPAEPDAGASDAIIVADRRWLEPMVRHLLLHCLRQARNGDTLQAQLQALPDRVRLTLTESRANAERARERVAVLSDFFRREYARNGAAPARHSSALLLARHLGELQGAAFNAQPCGIDGVCLSVDFFRQPPTAS